jgi:hypothetical protein
MQGNLYYSLFLLIRAGSAWRPISLPKIGFLLCSLRESTLGSILLYSLVSRRLDATRIASGSVWRLNLEGFSIRWPFGSSLPRELRLLMMDAEIKELIFDLMLSHCNELNGR